MYVRVRNDGKADSADSWVFAGDLVYCQENLRGRKEGDGMYIPVGLATGSQLNLLMTTDRMLGMFKGKKPAPVKAAAAAGSAAPAAGTNGQAR